MPKVSALTSAVTVSDTDILYLVSGTSSLKATISALAVPLVTGGSKPGSFTSLNIVGSGGISDLTSTSNSVRLFNTGVTTLNIGAAATTFNLGVLGGSTTILGNFTVNGTFTIANNQNFGSSITVAGNAAINGGNITSTASVFNIVDATVASINIGAAATNIRIGYTGTAASTVNISTNAAASGITKTLNIGTGGVSGSTTAINIGSSTAGSTSNISIGSPGGTTTILNTLVFPARTIAISGAATGTATSFNGSTNITIPITDLNASNLSVGTVPNARLVGTYTGFTNITGSGTVDFNKFYGNVADTASAPSFSFTGDTNTGIFQPGADQLGITTGGVVRLTVSTTSILYATEITTAVTSAIQIPQGTTAQRPTAAIGKIRFNTTLNSYEGYGNGIWSSLGGAATGGGNDTIFYENSQNVTVNYTVTGKNAMSAGPITINSGVTVTVATGARWVVV